VSLTDRFQLFDLRRDEGARTFEAREIATGRPVLVHLFANRTSPLNRVLLSKVDALPEKERLRVLDSGDHEGGVYLVTDRLAEYAGLREWLSQKDPRPRNPDSGTDWRKRAAKPSIDDQLANLFDTAPRPVLEPSPLAAPPVPVLTNTGQQTLLIPKPVQLSPPPAVRPISVPPPSTRPAPPAANKAGDVTFQFASPVGPDATAPAPGQPVAPAAAPPVPAANEPGEFTRQFAPVLRPVAAATSPVQAAAPAASPPVPGANEPGEFTRQFAPVLRPVAPAAAPVQPSPPAANEPGEFTQQFAPVLRPVPPPSAATPGEVTSEFTSPAPKTDQPMGEFTRQFQAPLRPVTSQPPTRVQAPTSNQSTQATQKDGEFTQMLKAQRPAAPATPTNQASARASEFDTYFQSPMSPPPGSTQQFRPMTPPPTPMRTGREGEFTQVFGPGDLAAPHPPSAPAPAPSAGATQVFRAPPPVASPGVNLSIQGSAQSPSQGYTPGPAQGPDEWGRMFETPASLTFGQPPAATQGARMPELAPSKVRRNSFPLPLLLMVAAAVLLLIAVIVYLVMRPH
jgi:hypothetical protein